MKSALLKTSIILIIILSIFGAGCIGTQTTDIVVGGNNIGKVSITPNNDAIAGGSGLTDIFDVKVEILGFEFTKDGVTSTEADQIKGRLDSGDIPGALELMDVEFKNDFVTFNPSTPEEFFDEIVNMPFSHKHPEMPEINFDDVIANIQYSANRIAEIFSNIFG